MSLTSRALTGFSPLMPHRRAWAGQIGGDQPAPARAPLSHLDLIWWYGGRWSRGPRGIDDGCRRAYGYRVTDSFPRAAGAGDRQAVQALYDVLGEDIANELVEWFNAVDLAYRTDLRELNELNFARFDAKLEQRLAELRSELLVELRTGMQQVRTELRTEVQQVRAELRTEIQQVRVELLRWMFGFWVTTLIGIAGLAIALR